MDLKYAVLLFQMSKIRAIVRYMYRDGSMRIAPMTLASFEEPLHSGDFVPMLYDSVIGINYMCCELETVNIVVSTSCPRRFKTDMTKKRNTRRNVEEAY